MNKKQAIKLFEEQKVRMEWDDEKEKFCHFLLESKNKFVILRTLLTAKECS
jgi:hypothetical protein